jgi:hypothetical protein
MYFISTARRQRPTTQGLYVVFLQNTGSLIANFCTTPLLEIIICLVFEVVIGEASFEEDCSWKCNKMCG